MMFDAIEAAASRPKVKKAPKVALENENLLGPRIPQIEKKSRANLGLGAPDAELATAVEEAEQVEACRHSKGAGPRE